MTKVATRRKIRFVRFLIQSIPDYISGNRNDKYGINKIYRSNFVAKMFELIYKSYEMRSEGRPDDYGNSFTRLKRETIAERPLRKGDVTLLGLSASQNRGVSLKQRTRGMLTPEQDKMWRVEFVKVFKKLVLNYSMEKAKEIASKIAWARVRRAGAKTKVEILGSRNVLIMRDTDRLFDSFEPSKVSNNSYRPKKDQLVKFEKGKITLGTLVPYADFHNKTRPIIPDNHDKMIDIAHEFAMEKVLLHIERILQ